MEIIINRLFLIILFYSLNSCGKEDIDINNISDFEEYLKDEMYFENIPALSILIYNENEVLYENYLGKSNIEQNINLSSNHLFMLASISKVVTASALLQLYEEDFFDLDDPINNFLPFNVNVPGYSENINFKMLLTHTSGVADGSAMDDQYFYGEDSPINLKFFLENYLLPNGDFYDALDNFYNFKPGTEYEYSNIGNALLAVLVEEISGLDFNTYCKQNIFSPLGMNETFWRLDEISQPISMPYDFLGGSNQAVGNYTFTDYPNGGLRSTVRDFYKFAKAFTQNGNSNNYQLLSPNTIEDMKTPQIPNIDNEVGLHLFLMNRDLNLWGHDGGEQGVATIWGFNPSTKIGAIVFTNQGETDLEEILEEAYRIGLKL